jgi:hypothetical protein
MINGALSRKEELILSCISVDKEKTKKKHVHYSWIAYD